MKDLVEQKVQELKERGLEEKYNHAGIYSISIEGRLVYIGKSTNMLQRIASHLIAIQRETNHKYSILREANENHYQIQFDVMYYTKRKREEAIKNDIGKREGYLIRKHKPALNYQIPREDNYKYYTVNKKAKTITLQEIMED